MPSLFVAAALLLVLFGVAFWVLRGDCDLRTRTARLPPGFYRGKIVWVTGASSGIGLAICEELARGGAHLIISARSKSALEVLSSQLTYLGASSVYVHPVDLSQGATVVASAARSALQVHGRLDMLVNNAGVGTRASVLELEDSSMRKLMEINFFAPVQLTRSCLAALVESRGIIINTSSLASSIALPLRSSYAASKAALERFFDSFRLESPSVHVMSLCPGRTDTRFSLNSMAPGGSIYGKTDSTTANGLKPQRVARVALAAAACGVRISWIAVPKELFAIRLASYFPDLWAVVVAKMYRAPQS